MKKLIFSLFALVKYIPKAQHLFNSWQLNFVEKVNLYKVGWNWDVGITAEWTLLTDTADVKKLKYDSAFAKVSSTEFEHHDEQRLLDARKEYESGDINNPDDTSIRIFVNRYIRYNKLVTKDQKEDMGLTVPDSIPSPPPDPDTILSSGELSGAIKKTKHLVQISEVKTVGVESVELEKGVQEIEVYISIVEDGKNLTPPASNTYNYAGQVKRGLYTQEFTEAQVAGRAFYKARKVFKGKQKKFGPWSNPWSGVIS